MATKTELSVEEKVYNLCSEYVEAKKEVKIRKDAVKAANEEVRRIQAEIEEAIDESLNRSHNTEV